jgi:hypothetical protein
MSTAPTAKQLGLYCKVCKADFSTNHEQMGHHRTDWHKFNLTRWPQRLPSLTKEEFDISISSFANISNSEFSTYIFKNYISSKLESGYCMKVLDIGCGDMIDAMYFYTNGCYVQAVDKNVASIPGINFIQDDIVNAVQQNKISMLFDIVYMRNVLDDTAAKEDIVKAGLNMLKAGGLLCIENQTAILIDTLKEYDIEPSPRMIVKKPFKNLYETSSNYPLYKAILTKVTNVAKQSYKDIVIFNRITEKYSIKYTIVSGSQLGLIRHGGIMPWENTINIGLLQSDFTKLLSYKNELAQSWLKMRIDKRDERYHFGVLDVYLLKDMGEYYEGLNGTLVYKTEYATIKKHAFGTTYVYAPIYLDKSLEQRYGANYYSVANVEDGITPPFDLQQEDRSFVYFA